MADEMAEKNYNVYMPEEGSGVKAWPDLPTALRSGILAMVRAAKG